MAKEVIGIGLAAEPVWMRDLDGTGSMHPCAKGDPGAIKYVPVGPVGGMELGILAMVHVVMANDYPAEVFTTKELAEDYMADQRARPSAGGATPRIHWRCYKFPLWCVQPLGSTIDGG